MAVCRILVAFVFLSFAQSGFAQNDRYMVFFKDKNNSPFLTSSPEAFLSAKAIQRRKHSFITVKSEDIPVNASYVSQVKAAGASVKTFFTSRWMNALLVQATRSDIDLINALPFVAKTELVAPGTRLSGGRVKQLKQKNSDSPGATQSQLETLGMNSMHADNIHGEGITISIFDGGFTGVNVISAFSTAFSENRIKLTKDFVTNSGNVYQFNNHGTEVFSVIGAESQGTFLGGAFKSNYMLFVTEDVSSEYRVEEYNWLFAAEKADSAGTDIIQSSLGYNTFDDASMDYTKSSLDGKTAVISKAAAMARDRGIIVVTSAGNEGNNSWSTITAPADVDGILAVGAVNSAGARAGFSSMGPSADGRIKPDLVALGQSTAVILTSGAVGFSSGTSFAAPLIASLAAGLLQTYPEMTPAEIVRAIKDGASKASKPDNLLGYGIPDYTSVKKYLEKLKADGFKLYPNPCDTTLTIEFTDYPQQNVEITIYNVGGQLISETLTQVDRSDGKLEIVTSPLRAGVYIIRIQSSTRLFTGRFVKI